VPNVALFGALLSCGSPASRRRPAGLVPHWFGNSRLVVHHPPRGFRRGGTQFFRILGDLPQAWGPLQSFSSDWWRAHTLIAPALSRGSPPPQRNPSVEVYRSRALPARVMLRPRTYHVARRLAPSADSLVSFQPGALAGCPFRALPGRNRHTSRCDFPSCDWLSDRRNRHKACLPASAVCTSTRLAVAIDRLIEQTDFGLSLSGVWCFSAFGAEASLPQRPRFRGFIPLSVGAYRPPDFSARRRPWLSWDSPL
jgi:hypothetical protein